MTDALEQLLKHDDAPWRYLNGAQLDANRLARMLKPYGIAPKQFKESGGKARGYLQAHFEDAWARYLPEPGTPVPSHENLLVERDSRVPGSPDLAGTETNPVPHKPHKQAKVPGVPGNGGDACDAVPPDSAADASKKGKDKASGAHWQSDPIRH